MSDYQNTFAAVVADPRYLANLDWGEARPGHPEGTVRAHIAEIEPNLEALRPKLTDEEYWKLKLLIHVHDSFKAESRPGAAITDPRSHASLVVAIFLRPTATTPICWRWCSITMSRSRSTDRSKARASTTRIGSAPC